MKVVIFCEKTRLFDEKNQWKKKKGKLIKIIEDLKNKIIEKYIREKKCTCSLVDKKRKKTDNHFIPQQEKKRETKMMLEKRQKIFAFLLPPVYWLKLKIILLLWLHCGTIIPKRDYTKILIDFANKLLKTDNCWQKNQYVVCEWVRFLKKDD